ncbi:MAG: DUF5677 domain-containing protein [Bacilli bacterium]|nr:DUF5677 domain-containing protein [Bacilli bacterium]
MAGLSYLGLPEFFDNEFCYEIYLLANEGIEMLNSSHENILSKDIDQRQIILYTAGEILYSIDNDPNNYSRIKNEEVMNQIAGVVADKYISLSMFNHDQGKMTNKFLPPASSLDIYINFMLNIINSYRKNDPRSTLIVDLLNKSLSISRCILNLLVEGYETEAFASWRTLHECECTLILLDKYGDELMNNYLKHMQYGLAFNNSIEDKEKQDQIFYKMKEEMKGYNLKSKDIKKYIEYGWMYGIPGTKEDENFKLNFRDGLQKLAGLEAYNQRYELSSEVIHSTPLLIYSRKQFFYYLTFLCLYESFFRLEKVFTSLFSKRVSEDQMAQYISMRNLYYAQLVAIHQRESIKFSQLSPVK